MEELKMCEINEEIRNIRDDFDAERLLRERIEDESEKERLVADCQKMIDFYNEKIEGINERYDNKIAYIDAQLRAFMEMVNVKETATLKKYELPSGTLKITKAKKDYEPDKERLIEYLKENDPGCIRVKEEVAWGDFKKKLSIIDDQVVNTETGEVIECINVVEKPEKFSIG